MPSSSPPVDATTPSPSTTNVCDDHVHDSSSSKRAPFSRTDLETILEIPILDFDLYVRACTHKSVKTGPGHHRSYERSEFLGDSVLNFVVTKLLYDRYPTSNEGFLTRIRTKLVSGDYLARLSTHLGLDRFVIMSARAYTQHWHKNRRILEDVFEALVGAIYLDRGLPYCRRFIERLFDKYVDWTQILEDTNHKDQLMRACQRKGWKTPIYEVFQTHETDKREKTYDIQVHVSEHLCVGRGVHTNKRKAEQLAAKNAIEVLHLSVPQSSASNM